LKRLNKATGSQGKPATFSQKSVTANGNAPALAAHIGGTQGRSFEGWALMSLPLHNRLRGAARD